MIKDGDIAKLLLTFWVSKMGYDDGIIAKLQQWFFNGKFVEIWLTQMFDSDIKDALKMLFFILSWVNIVNNNLFEIWLDYK